MSRFVHTVPGIGFICRPSRNKRIYNVLKYRIGFAVLSFSDAVEVLRKAEISFVVKRYNMCGLALHNSTVPFQSLLLIRG